MSELLSFVRDARIAASKARSKLEKLAAKTSGLKKEVEMLEAQELYLRLLEERLVLELQKGMKSEAVAPWVLRVVDRIEKNIPLAGDLKERFDTISKRIRSYFEGREDSRGSEQALKPGV